MGPGEHSQKIENEEWQASLRVIQVSKKATETLSHSAQEHSSPSWWYLVDHG